MEQKKKKIIQFTAFGIAVLIILSLIITMALMAARPGRSSNMAETENFGGMTVGSAEADGIAVQTAQIDLRNLSAGEREQRGISRLAETAYTLTATVNDDANVKEVDWTVAFNDPSSEWATGKTATDYITVSRTGPLTATVSCLQAFGEQIIVSAVSKDDPRVKADCTCDYKTRIIGATVTIGNETWYQDPQDYFAKEIDITADSDQLLTEKKFSLDKTYYFNVAYITGIGTITPFHGSMGSSEVTTKVTISLNEGARSKLAEKSYTAEPSSAIEIEIADSFSSKPNKFDRDTVKKVFGENALTGKTLKEAIETLQGENMHSFLDLKIEFGMGGETYNFRCTLDVEAESVYNPVTSVQIDQSGLVF